MTMRAGMTGALAAMALMIAVPVGGMQQQGGGMGNPFPQDPMGQMGPMGPPGQMGQPVPPASQGGMSSPSRNSRRLPGTPSMDDQTPSPLTKTGAEMARAQNAARQKQIVEETNKLLDLALELKQDVNKSNKDTLSMDVVKKAEEIEKLAHQVKEKMKE